MRQQRNPRERREACKLLVTFCAVSLAGILVIGLMALLLRGWGGAAPGLGLSFISPLVGGVMLVPFAFRKGVECERRSRQSGTEAGA
jgi:CHASE2 domain-containing sensor protein